MKSTSLFIFIACLKLLWPKKKFFNTLELLLAGETTNRKNQVSVGTQIITRLLQE